MLVPLLGIYSYNTAYSSISPSSIYDNIQKKFDNLLPFEVPQLDNEENTDPQSNDDTESQSAQKKFNNLLPFKVSPQGEKIPLELPPLDEDFPFEVPQLDKQGEKIPFEVPQLDKQGKTDSQSAEMAATADPSCRASLFWIILLANTCCVKARHHPTESGRMFTPVMGQQE